MSSLIYNSFKSGLMNGTFNLGSDGHIIKVALVIGYTSNPTHVYWGDSGVSSAEISGTGYVSGGQIISTLVDGSTSIAKFDTAGDVTWANSVLSASGAIIYDSTVSGNPLICFIDFGGTQSTLNGSFTLSWTGSSNIIISLT